MRAKSGLAIRSWGVLLALGVIGAGAPALAAPEAAKLAAQAGGFPSFLNPSEVFCQDELDFNAYARTGKFHTRGSTESCLQLTQLTRVVVLSQAGVKSKTLIVGGPLDAHVGWTNGGLPFPRPK